MINIEPNSTDQEIIDLVNTKIATLTQYGMRTESCGARWAIVLYWSNAHQKWVAGTRNARGGRISLDANEIAVDASYVTSRQMDQLAPNFIPHPLFGNSTEARGLQ